ncbi:MAG: zinc ABC transporter substrate-binding protein, partial [Candidatus Hydrogenedentes bacterium]|nr:zinc ABC transporter substrate-binding protein [Candidatus Hydrogenedentota bacterium]
TGTIGLVFQPITMSSNVRTAILCVLCVWHAAQAAQQSSMRRARRLARRFAVAGLLFYVAALAGCGPALQAPESADTGNGSLPVVVSIPPLASLAQRIGGERVSVNTLLAPGEGPHTFAPTPKQVMALGEAAIYFHVGGFPFERELAKRIEANFPSLAVQDVGEGIARREGSQHHHVEKDPHFWMSPPLLKTMAKTIAETLKRVDPAHGETYQANLERTLQDLDALDQEIRQKLAPYKGRTFYIYHPALGYFAETYALDQASVEVGGQKPTPRQLQQLIEQAKEDKVRVIFVQPQFDQRSAQAVAEAIQGELLPLDPLKEDVFANLREITTELSEAFSGKNMS